VAVSALDDLQTLIGLGVALAIGLLVGLERGWNERARAEGARVAGIRTFGLAGLAGGISAVVAGSLGGLFAAAALVSVAAFATATRIRAQGGGEPPVDRGITTLVALVCVFGLGAMAGSDFLVEAAILSVLVTLLLGVKPEIHAFVARIDRRELFATIRLLLITVVVLPVLPDQGFGPWQAINPFRMWLMVVLIAAISYVGYVAVGMIGSTRGILATALFGGLSSSTAVAINLGRLGRERPGRHDLLAAGIIAASSIMFPRMLVVSAVIAPSLFDALVLPFGGAAATGIAVAAWYLWRGGDKAGEPGEEAIRSANPLELGTALKFGLLLVAVMVLARAARDWAGHAGLYALAAASGVADVDAILLSLASMTWTGEASVGVAATGVLIAASVNSLVKPALVLVSGGWRLAFRVVWPLVAAAGVAIVILAWVPPLSVLATAIGVGAS
jgi:uncharacterized membrane protein (DUF4010 family)